MSTDTRFITLSSGLIAGPAVSLNGSPTVSPMIVASWASEPLPPCAPSSTIFFALSHDATGVGEEHRHQRTGADRPGEEAGERADAQAEADGDRHERGEQTGRRELAQRVTRADVDDAAVLRLLGVVHDAGVLAELAAHLEDDGTGRPRHRVDGEAREEEDDRRTDEHADEHARGDDLEVEGRRWTTAPGCLGDLTGVDDRAGPRSATRRCRSRTARSPRARPSRSRCPW